MRIILSLFILLLSVVSVSAQKLTVTVTVNEQVELATVVARLAGFEEFVNHNFKSYAESVDNHFGKYRDHELIKFAQKLRETNRIAFSQYLSLPAHLNADYTQKVVFTESVPHKDFGRKNAEEFVRLLRKFYQDAECEKFFKDHAAMFRAAEQRYQEVVNKIDFPWFEKFYGERPDGTFMVNIGLLAGGGNFGEKVIYPNNKKESIAIMGVTAADEKGVPIFSAEAELPVIIHEFNHSFINYLVDDNPKPFQVSCEIIYKLVAEKMKRQAYGGWQTPLNESLVRAAVIRYLFEHQGIEEANAEIINEKASGFVWMDELFTLLGTYENNRERYSTLRSFMPVLAGYHIDLAKRIDDKVARFEESKPKIIAIEEFKNEAQGVDPNTAQLTFIFERPMKKRKGISMDYGKNGEAGFPELRKGTAYSEDGMKFTLPVKLKPDWEYEFVVYGNSFTSKDGYPAQNYMVKFKTAK